jgi:hypothetical protein
MGNGKKKLNHVHRGGKILFARQRGTVWPSFDRFLHASENVESFVIIDDSETSDAFDALDKIYSRTAFIGRADVSTSISNPRGADTV